MPRAAIAHLPLLAAIVFEGVIFGSVEARVANLRQGFAYLNERSESALDSVLQLNQALRLSHPECDRVGLLEGRSLFRLAHLVNFCDAPVGHLRRVTAQAKRLLEVRIADRHVGRVDKFVQMRPAMRHWTTPKTSHQMRHAARLRTSGSETASSYTRHCSGGFSFSNWDGETTPRVRFMIGFRRLQAFRAARQDTPAPRERGEKCVQPNSGKLA